MRRSFLCTVISAALIPAASLWAAPTAAAPGNRYIDQIEYQTQRIQAEADGLQGYVRSGAHDRRSTYAYAHAMAGSLNKLGSAVDHVADQRGLTPQTHQQADKMKVEVAELRAIVADTVNVMNPNEPGLRAEAVFADTNNIESRGQMIRNAAENLAAEK